MRSAAKLASGAFAARELVVICGAVAMLACVHLSALSNGAYQSKLAQCAANLKQYVLAVQAVGNENNNRLPFVGNTFGGGHWPWDLGATTVNTLVTNYGLTRQNFYCPGFPQQNINQNWNFNSNMRVTGYATALPTTDTREFSDDIDIALTTQFYTLNGSDPSFGPAGATVYIPPPRRMLLADAILSSNNQTNPALVATYQWQPQNLPPPGTPTPYGPWTGYYNTPHIGTLTPTGGNIAMLDGHIEWRPFTNMLPRTDAISDVFWW